MTVETKHSCYISIYKNAQHIFERGQEIQLMLTSGDLNKFSARRVWY